jgi:hypothetical protein
LPVGVLGPGLGLCLYYQPHYRLEQKRIAYADVTSKVAAFASIIRTFSFRVDAILCLILVLVAAILVLSGRDWRVHSIVFSVAAVFGMLALLAPFEVATSQYVDLRFVLPAWILGIISIDVRLGRKAVYAIAILLVGFVFLRIGSVWHEWENMSRKTEEIVQIFAGLKQGCSDRGAA